MTTRTSLGRPSEHQDRGGVPNGTVPRHVVPSGPAEMALRPREDPRNLEEAKTGGLARGGGVLAKRFKSGSVGMPVRRIWLQKKPHSWGW